MGADVLNNVNAMPAPTWHRLDMNETAVELPEGLSFAAQAEVEAAAELIGEAGAFDAAVAALQERVDEARAAGPADTRAILKAVDPDVDPANLDIPALSTYEHKAVRQEMANNVAEAFECGMGEQATAWLAEAAGKGAATVFAPAAGKRGQATVRIAGVDGAANVAAIDVVAPAGAAFDLTVSLDSPAAGSGVVGVVLRVFAGENAHVNVTSVHTLDEPAGGVEHPAQVVPGSVGEVRGGEACAVEHLGAQGVPEGVALLLLELAADGDARLFYVDLLGHVVSFLVDCRYLPVRGFLPFAAVRSGGDRVRAAPCGPGCLLRCMRAGLTLPSRSSSAPRQAPGAPSSPNRRLREERPLPRPSCPTWWGCRSP